MPTTGEVYEQLRSLMGGGRIDVRVDVTVDRTTDGVQVVEEHEATVHLSLEGPHGMSEIEVADTSELAALQRAVAAVKALKTPLGLRDLPR